MRYGTRHGFGGHERQLHPRAEKAILAGILLGSALVAAILSII